MIKYAFFNTCLILSLFVQMNAYTHTGTYLSTHLGLRTVAGSCLGSPTNTRERQPYLCSVWGWRVVGVEGGREGKEEEGEREGGRE